MNRAILSESLFHIVDDAGDGDDETERKNERYEEKVSNNRITTTIGINCNEKAKSFKE